ncbi:MAG: UDPglucose 6-dehydrogenase [Pirellulaceae bacterium]|jgi:UDPglucose 6-dehydrogenase
MRICVVGTGYVGLVTGTCFAENGHTVFCVDIDQAKIDGLQNNKLPIYEPGLEELVSSNQRFGRLNFTTDLAGALDHAEVVFIAVGTPQADDGSANLKYVWAVANDIRENAKDSKVVVIKSTVPVGTNAGLLERLNSGSIQHYGASNPEFLREGLAVDDCMNPERVVIGIRDQHTEDTLRELYAPYTAIGVPLLLMGPESAEMTKYVANCLLASRISFMNEMANLCERVGADVTQVREGIGMDSRIGPKFLNPGAGYGGSCFPKDTRALMALARDNGVELRILPEVDQVNEEQKQRFFEKLSTTVGDLNGATIGIWGLAFKPQTDDIREAPALLTIQNLLDAGAVVRVYDPEATENVRTIFGDKITYCEDMYAVLDDASALAILTEWEQFERPDFDEIHNRLAAPVIVDGRNMYEPTRMARLGFTYNSVGRQVVAPLNAAVEANEV